MGMGVPGVVQGLRFPPKPKVFLSFCLAFLRFLASFFRIKKLLVSLEASHPWSRKEEEWGQSSLFVVVVVIKKGKALRISR